MGRSVSYATGSVAKVYYDITHHGHTYDEDVNPDGGYCDDVASWDWQDFKEGLRHDIEMLWPSFKPLSVEQARRVAIDCDEGVVIMENDLCYIGLSEYCGLACLWLVPKESDGYYGEDIKRDNLARGFCSRISKKFTEKFGDLNKLGTFSNGESVYERKAG